MSDTCTSDPCRRRRRRARRASTTSPRRRQGDGRLRAARAPGSSGSRRTCRSAAHSSTRDARVRGLRARGRGRHLVRRRAARARHRRQGRLRLHPARACRTWRRTTATPRRSRSLRPRPIAAARQESVEPLHRARLARPATSSRRQLLVSLRTTAVALSSSRGRRDQRVRALHQRRDGRGLLVPRPRRAGVRRGARHRAARGRARDRPRRRGRARRARRRLGQDARERALPPPARARRRDRREPQGALGARVAERRQGDLLDEGRALRRRRELPLLRLRDRLDRRPLEPDRRLAALVHAEGAGRRRRPDRARGTTRC